MKSGATQTQRGEGGVGGGVTRCGAMPEAKALFYSAVSRSVAGDGHLNPAVIIQAWGRAQHFSRQAFGALGLRGTVRLFKAVGRALADGAHFEVFTGASTEREKSDNRGARKRQAVRRCEHETGREMLEGQCQEGE